MSILGALEREGQHALKHGLGKGPLPPQKTNARPPLISSRRRRQLARVDNRIESFYYHRESHFHVE